MIGFTVSGKVVDEKNKGIADVNVYERNGSGNARTDANGNFFIKVGSLENDLQFSHLSYGKETISIETFKQTNVFYFLPIGEMLDDVIITPGRKKDDNTLFFVALLALGVAIGLYTIKKREPVKVKV